MVIQAAASAVTAVLVVAANWQYVAEVIRREAHPRLVSWAIWAVSMGIACAGSAMAGQLPAAALAGAGAAGSLVILIAGWKHGDRDVGWLDAWCAAVGGAGAILLAESVIWPGVVPVAAAITASVVADASAFVPTWRNAWRGNEPLRPFVMFTAAAIISLAVSDLAVPAAVIFPIYETAACALACLLIAASPARRRSGMQQAPADSGLGDVAAAEQIGAAEIPVPSQGGQ